VKKRNLGAQGPRAANPAAKRNAPLRHVRCESRHWRARATAHAPRGAQIAVRLNEELGRHARHGFQAVYVLGVHFQYSPLRSCVR
jgi:hypothetical protein